MNPGVIGLPVASIQWQFFAVCTGFPGCQAPHLEFAPGWVRLATQRPPDTLSEVFSPGANAHTMASREERYEAAEQLKNQGQLAEAVTALEAVVADHPDFALAHSALAAWCTRLERHDEAIRHARRVCELEPKDPFSYTALSVACMRGGRIAEAEDALARSRMLQG